MLAILRTWPTKCGLMSQSGPSFHARGLRADWMADKQIFHFAAAVDEHCLRVLVQEFEGFAGLQVLHSGNSSTAVRTRICRLVRPI